MASEYSSSPAGNPVPERTKDNKDTKDTKSKDNNDTSLVSLDLVSLVSLLSFVLSGTARYALGHGFI
jgi:hypothetical protein